jgi:hypothetical protein
VIALRTIPLVVGVAVLFGAGAAVDSVARL